MNLKFEIINKKIKQKTNFEKSDNIICTFRFVTSEWNSLEKYIVIWNEKKKSLISSLGKENKTNYTIPNGFIKGDCFYIQIYTDNNLFTDKIKVDSFIESEQCPHYEQQCPSENNEQQIEEECRCHEGIDTNYIIDNVKYKDNKILFYSENKLIKSIDILDTKLLEKIQNGLSFEYVVDLVLSEESENAIANKTVYNALLDFLKESDLARIAITGDYNDLKNIPTEFNPSYHNHLVVDVIDYEENIDYDLGKLLDGLYDEITKE